MKNVFVLVAVAILIIGMAAQAAATTITYGSTFEFSGATAPVGNAPWLTTIFDDSTGSVTLTLKATNLTNNEFVSGWYLNFAQESQVENLVFSAPTKTGSFESPTISLGANSYKPDGDGKFDILLSFSTSDGLNTRFTAGDSVSYTVSGITGLTANSFNVSSEPVGSKGPFMHAEHVQSIGSGSLSGWVSGPLVPEPSGVLAMLIGLVGAVGLKLRRK